jgi:hypothetical protein
MANLQRASASRTRQRDLTAQFAKLAQQHEHRYRSTQA